MTERDRIAPMDVRATVTPGLVVHLRDVGPMGPARWHVVHEDSGQPLRALARLAGDAEQLGPIPVVLAYDSPEVAVAVADALAGLTDWRAPAYELQVAHTIGDGELLYEVGIVAAEVQGA